MTETTDKTIEHDADKAAPEAQKTPSADSGTDSAGHSGASKAGAKKAPVKKAPAKKAAAHKPAAAKKAAGDAKSDAKSSGQKKSGGRGVLWTVAVLAIIGGGVAVSWPQLAPHAEPYVSELRALLGLPVPAPDSAPTPAPEPVAEAEPVSEPSPEATTPEASPEPAAEATPEAAPEVATEVAPEGNGEPTAVVDVAPSVDSGGVDALAGRLDELQSQVDALYKTDQSESLASALDGVKAELADLSARLDTLEQAPRMDPTASAQALVLAVTQVRARLMGDGPFAAELAALERIAASDDVVAGALSRLRTNADVGVPTEGALTARFDTMARDIMHARAQGADAGWIGRVKDSLGALVTVRRTNPEAITDEVERAVAVAEASLQLGDLNGAVEALSGLQGTPGDAAAPWLGDARARLDAEDALETLHNHALAVLSSAGGN